MNVHRFLIVIEIADDFQRAVSDLTAFARQRSDFVTREVAATRLQP